MKNICYNIKQYSAFLICAFFLVTKTYPHYREIGMDQMDIFSSNILEAFKVMNCNLAQTAQVERALLNMFLG